MDCDQDSSPVDQIVASVRASPKYRALCEETVRRIAADEWAKMAPSRSRSNRALKQAAKATRSRLHQVYGAYESALDYGQAYRSLQAAHREGTPAALRSACSRVLSLHASTRERLPILDRFYDGIWACTGIPSSVLDLACGLNPLSWPWMGLGSDVPYRAYDIDIERVSFLQRYFALAGLQGGARLQDIISSPPRERAELALLLKSSPCLERQQAGSTLAILDLLSVRYAVVTFPLRSLGSRGKGMMENYQRFFRDLVSDRPWVVQRLVFESELAFVVDKGQVRSQ